MEAEPRRNTDSVKCAQAPQSYQSNRQLSCKWGVPVYSLYPPKDINDFMYPARKSGSRTVGKARSPPMRGRFFLSTLLFAGILLPLTSCGGNGLSKIEIVPSGDVSLTVGQEVQFTAWGFYGNSNKVMPNKNITDEVNWGYTTSVLQPCPGTPTVPGCFLAASVGVAVVGASAPSFNGTAFSIQNATVTVTKAP